MSVPQNKAFKTLCKQHLRDMWWKIHGRKIHNPPAKSDNNSFLFVCKGNICRSPFAEEMFRIILLEAGLGGFQCASAGLLVPTPERSPETARIAAKKYHVDLDDHLSKDIRDIDVDAFDMIIVMEAAQCKEIMTLLPQTAGRVFLLPLITDRADNMTGYAKYNIEDPYGKTVDDFERCYERISLCLRCLLKNI